MYEIWFLEVRKENNELKKDIKSISDDFFL